MAGIWLAPSCMVCDCITYKIDKLKYSHPSTWCAFHMVCADICLLFQPIIRLLWWSLTSAYYRNQYNVNALNLTYGWMDLRTVQSVYKYMRFPEGFGAVVLFDFGRLVFRNSNVSLCCALTCVPSAAADWSRVRPCNTSHRDRSWKKHTYTKTNQTMDKRVRGCEMESKSDTAIFCYCNFSYFFPSFYACTISDLRLQLHTNRESIWPISCRFLLYSDFLSLKSNAKRRYPYKTHSHCWTLIILVIVFDQFHAILWCTSQWSLCSFVKPIVWNVVRVY